MLKFIIVQNGKMTGYGEWEDDEYHIKLLENLKDSGFQKTSKTYVLGYDGNWYVKGKEPYDPRIVWGQISKLKDRLAETDYVDIKIMEAHALGLESEYKELIAKYKDIILERRNIRQQIRDLENNESV